MSKRVNKAVKIGKDNTLVSLKNEPRRMGPTPSSSESVTDYQKRLSITRESSSEHLSENMPPNVAQRSPLSAEKVQWAKSILALHNNITPTHELVKRLNNMSARKPTESQTDRVPCIPPRNDIPFIDVPGPSTMPQNNESRHSDEVGTSDTPPTHQTHGPYSGISGRVVLNTQKSQVALTNDPPSGGGNLEHEDGVLENDIEFEQDMTVPLPKEPGGRQLNEMAEWKGNKSGRVLLVPYETLDGFDMKIGTTTIISLLKRHYKGEASWAQVSGPSRDIMWGDFGMRCTWDKKDEPKVIQTWNEICRVNLPKFLNVAKQMCYKDK